MFLYLCQWLSFGGGSSSNPVPLPDLYFDSFSYPVDLLFLVTWLLCHYFFFFFSQSQILSGKVQARSGEGWYVCPFLKRPLFSEIKVTNNLTSRRSSQQFVMVVTLKKNQNFTFYISLWYDKHFARWSKHVPIVACSFHIVVRPLDILYEQMRSTGYTGWSTWIVFESIQECFCAVVFVAKTLLP